MLYVCLYLFLLLRKQSFLWFWYYDARFELLGHLQVLFKPVGTARGNKLNRWGFFVSFWCCFFLFLLFFSAISGIYNKAGINEFGWTEFCYARWISILPDGQPAGLLDEQTDELMTWKRWLLPEFCMFSHYVKALSSSCQSFWESVNSLNQGLGKQTSREITI